MSIFTIIVTIRINVQFFEIKMEIVLYMRNQIPGQL